MVGEKKIEPPCLSRLSCRCVYLSLSPTPVCVSIFLSIPPCLFLFIPSLLSVLLSFSLCHHISLSTPVCVSIYLSLSLSLSPTSVSPALMSVLLSFSLPHSCLCFYLSPSHPVFLSLPHSCLCLYLSLSVTTHVCASVSILISLSLCGSLFLSVSPSHPVSLYISLSLTPVSFSIFFLSVALSH